jgi:hypothetical protein
MSYVAQVKLIPSRSRDELEHPWPVKLDKMLELLASHLATIRECGADEIRLDHAYFHDGQCNHEFESAELGRIANLGITFSISCYGPEKTDH